jgi:hypothetical protein
LPWRRALLGLLAGPALLSQLASPERIPSHNSLTVAALTVVLLFNLAELFERWRRPAASRLSPWLGWTIAGLLALVTLTYFFSSFYKWNPVFFWPRSSPAMEFATPYAALLGLPQQVALRLLAWPFILGTVLLELLLPVLLLCHRTRLAGSLVGLVFHVLMMGQGVVDFPLLIVAFYPLFYPPAEFAALMARCRRRPSALRLGLVLAGSAAGSLALSRSEYVAEFWSGAAAWPVLLLVHSLALHLTLYLVIYVAAALGAALFQPLGRRPSGPPQPAPAG